MTDQQIEALVQDGLERVDSGYEAGVSYMAGELSAMIGIQAPVELVDGRLRATTPALKGDPPRRVSGFLQSKVGFDRVGPGYWVYGIRSGVPYASILEYYMNHPYFGRLIMERLGTLTSVVAAKMRKN